MTYSRGGAVIQWRRYAIACAVEFLTVFTLTAQTPTLRDRDREPEGRKALLADLQRARLHYGPFYLVSRLELRNLGFDQEINIPTGDEVEDVTLTVAAPQKLFFVPSKKIILSAQAEPAYVWFNDREDLRQWNYLYRGDVHLVLNRLYADIFATRSDETVRDLAEIGRLVDRKTRVAGIETEFKFTSKTAVRIRHTDTGLDYTRGSEADLEGERLERTEALNSLLFEHKTFPRTALSLMLESENFDFDFADNRDGNLYAIYAGAERTGTAARLIGQPIRIQLGYAQLDYDDPAEKDYRGPVGTATIAFSPHRNLILNAAAERSLQFSIFESNNHYAADRAELVTTYSMGRRFDLFGSLEYGINHYFIPAIDPLDGRSKNRADELTLETAGVKYRLPRGGILGLGVGYYQRDSNFSRFNEDGIRLFVQLSISP